MLQRCCYASNDCSGISGDVLRNGTLGKDAVGPWFYLPLTWTSSERLAQTHDGTQQPVSSDSSWLTCSYIVSVVGTYSVSPEKKAKCLGASQSHGDCGKWKIIYIYINNIYNDSEGPLQNKPQTLADYEFEWIWSKLIGIAGVGYHPPQKKWLATSLALCYPFFFTPSPWVDHSPGHRSPGTSQLAANRMIRLFEKVSVKGNVILGYGNYLKKLSASQGTAWNCNMCKSWTGKLLLDPNKNLTDSSESFASTSKRSSETWTIPMGTWSQHQHLAGYSTCVENS